MSLDIRDATSSQTGSFIHPNLLVYEMEEKLLPTDKKLNSPVNNRTGKKYSE